MKRRVKLWAGSLLAVCAIAGASAPAVLATPNFEAGQHPAIVKANQTPGSKLTLDFGGSKVTCDVAELVGSIGGPEPQVAMGPFFTGCTAFGFTGATVETSGCELILTAGEESQPRHHLASANLRCLEGAKIAIKASTCEVQIGAQSGLSGFELINEPLAKPRKSVTLVTDVKGLAYTTTEDGSLCPLAGVGSFNDGSIAGIQTMTAERSGEASVKFNLAVNDAPPPPPLFESSEYPPIVEANQIAGEELTLDFGGDKVTCNVAELVGVIGAPAPSITMGAIFTGCTAFGFTGATVETSGCELTLIAGEGFQAVRHLATANLKCVEGAKIAIKAATCEVQIGTQSGLRGFELINNPARSPKTVTLISDVKGLAYTTTKDGPLCPLEEVGSLNDGTITGTQVMVAERSGEASVKFDFSVSTEPVPPALEAGQYPAALKSAQTTTNTISVEGNNATCSANGTTGSLSAPSASFALHPTFTDCTIFGFVGGTIDTTGCDYAYNVGEAAGPERHDATLGIACTGTNVIKLVAGTCEVHIGGQEARSGVKLTNIPNASPRRNVTISLAVVGLKVTKVRDGFLCPLSGTGPASGTMTGNHALSAESPANPTQKLDLFVNE